MKQLTIEQETEMLNEIKQAVHKFQRDAKVILFGSRARGDSKVESDWDILILTHSELSWAQRENIQDQVYEIELQNGQSLSTVFETEINRSKYSFMPFYQAVQNEGKTL